MSLKFERRFFNWINFDTYSEKFIKLNIWSWEFNGYNHLSFLMVSRLKFHSSSEIGVYVRITNSYALIPYDTSESFLDSFKRIFPETFPIIKSNIAGTDIIGRLTAGNKNGLILPLNVTESEINSIREQLPEEIELIKIPEKFSALGNVISCNDRFALVHPELDQATIESISDTLGVEVIPATIGGESLVGSYSVLTNKGGAVSSAASVEQIEELSNHLQIPIEAATVNSGLNLLSGGLCVNDSVMITGWNTTALEIANLTKIFKIDDSGVQTNDFIVDDSLIDMIL